MVRTVSGSSRIVVPVNRSRPNSAPMNNSGAQIHLVNPSESGPPMAKPTNPAARADEEAAPRVDPCGDRAGGVEPGTGGDDDGDAQQREGNPVAAMARIDL